MNERIEALDPKSSTVSVWTPWGEQKVPRTASRAAHLRNALGKERRRDEPASEMMLAGLATS